MTRRLTAAAVLLMATALRADAPPDLDAIARGVFAGTSTATDKVRAAVNWTNKNFDWTTTDYKTRTVEETVARKGGNCNEQTMVVRV